ncbi:MAG: biopolymer transporter ExbD [bacterium]|jgi:biopolymer transport protein ExbD|nr:biopolymer transporter ExbD [bacterium]NBS51877.1 biopolymer transporter ExbD [Spartobacteria bacterium]
MTFRSARQTPQGLFFNVTSLVDVLLVLVIFLLVSWTESRVESELAIELPKSSSAPQHSVLKSPILVNIRSGGEITVNQRPIKDAGLRDMLSSLVKLDAGQSVVLRSDKSVPYERILQVLDLCNESGVTALGFGALPPNVKPQ